jgi:hypothetical protein
MNRISLHILLPLLCLGIFSPLGADIPKKQVIGRYSKLWSKSPFTTPPVVEVGEPGPGALDDYVLTGVSKLPAGYFVVLMDKKKRDKRVTIIPGEINSQGFKVVSVIQDPIDYKATQVRISVRGETGMIGYDEKFLALKKGLVAAKKPPVKPGTRPPGVRPPTTHKPTTTRKPSRGRTPRVRRVPTPPKR